MTRDEIQVAYTKLAAEVGDLYFVIDATKETLAAHESRMSALKQQRQALAKAFQEAPADVPAAPETEAPTSTPPEG